MYKTTNHNHNTWKNDSLLERATIHWFHILVDCCVVLDLFYICQRMNNWLDLVYFDVSHGTSFFMIDVDCGAQALPIIAISTLNPSHISCPWYVIFLYIVVCSFTLPAAISIRSSWFCDIKITTKSDVVGCHIGLSPSSTARNQSPIPVDCCVNVILPLMSSMVSFTAKMVVLRRVCEVPTQRQKLSPHWSNPPSTTN